MSDNTRTLEDLLKVLEPFATATCPMRFAEPGRPASFADCDECIWCKARLFVTARKQVPDPALTSPDVESFATDLTRALGLFQKGSVCYHMVIGCMTELLEADRQGRRGCRDALLEMLQVLVLGRSLLRADSISPIVLPRVRCALSREAMVTMRETLREAAREIDCPPSDLCPADEPCTRRPLAAALRTLADRIDAEIRATEGDEAESRANVIRAILLARLDAPPTEPTPELGPV